MPARNSGPAHHLHDAARSWVRNKHHLIGKQDVDEITLACFRTALEYELRGLELLLGDERSDPATLILFEQTAARYALGATEYGQARALLEAALRRSPDPRTERELRGLLLDVAVYAAGPDEAPAP